MANKELITCDYAGCDKPFAYRQRGFNLCHEHCSFRESMLQIAIDVLKKQKAKEKEKL